MKILPLDIDIPRELPEPGKTPDKHQDYSRDRKEEPGGDQISAYLLHRFFAFCLSISE